jgi:hypothetical protein
MLNLEKFNMASPKSFLGPLFERAKNVTDVLTLKRARAKKWQDRTIKKMLFQARATAVGQFYDFDSILMVEDTVAQFKSKVPITDYDGMHSWWQREYQGEDNVTWPGSTKYFALSSGTTQGASKYIPVTGDQLKSIMRASRRAVVCHRQNRCAQGFLHQRLFDDRRKYGIEFRRSEVFWGFEWHYHEEFAFLDRAFCQAHRGNQTGKRLAS